MDIQSGNLNAKAGDVLSFGCSDLRCLRQHGGRKQSGRACVCAHSHIFEDSGELNELGLVREAEAHRIQVEIRPCYGLASQHAAQQLNVRALVARNL